MGLKPPCTLALLVFTSHLVSHVGAIVSRNGKDFFSDEDFNNNVGVGEMEEVPISSLTLKFAEPSLKIQRSLMQQYNKPQADAEPSSEYQNNNEEYDYVEDEEHSPQEINLNGATVEGEVETIPIDSMRVKFDPVVRFGHPVPGPQLDIQDAASPEVHCERRCVLPAMPSAMLAAAQHCNVQLIYNQQNYPTLQENHTREGRSPKTTLPRRLQSSPRTACGSKCVLEELNLMRERGVPDVDRVTGFLLQSAGHVWVLALREANSICSRDIQTSLDKTQVFGHAMRLSERHRCQISTSFMKCIRLQLINNCPETRFREECHSVEEEE